VASNSSAGDTVCAQVKIEIKQELTLERQAFDAMMRINNGLDTLPINNVKVTVNFEDEEGQPVLASSDPDNTNAKFFIRVDTMNEIADVNGNGSVAPATTAEIHWLIIPATGAAEDSPTGKVYFVGAQLDYTLGGEAESLVVTPDFITVKPLPKLTLDYFLTKEVNADDPLTTEIEPIEPYTLGVRVQNNGLAAAKDLKIDSAQPKITENEQGLLIGFEITGSSVNDEPIAPVLLIDFGDIAGNSSKVGRWEMTSTLAGEFVDFTATFTHADELGGALTSILEATNAHLLVRDVLVDLPGRDGVRDFLAIDTDILRVYESDSVDTLVTDHSSQASFTQESQSGTQVDHRLSFPATEGFSYVKLPDPYNGEKIITQVVRSDGKVIPLHNAWTSKSRDKSTHPYGWTHYVNFFDTQSTGTYAVRMDAEVLGPVPPVLQFISARTTYEGNPVGFVVEASDPNGETPALSAAPLPNGAAFVDNGDGTAFFNWTPAVGQAGTYVVNYTATDGALAASRSATIKVNPEWDTDGDGIADAWELEHFGNLDRDGSGDFDGDGVSDLDEYLQGTDPSNGPLAPAIDSPLYDAEVTSLRPTLTVANSAHAPDVTLTYSYEVYADAAMTQRVASANNLAEGQETTSWTLPVDLDDNRAYSWRVRAYDGHVYSLWSHGRFFVNTVNDAPGAFTISSPVDGAEVDSSAPLLVVTNALEPDGDAVSYRFEVSEFEDISTTVASVESIAAGTGGTTGWLVDVPLSENGYYYWRATAMDEHGLETPGPIAGFFINATNEAPLAPVVNAPTDGGVVTGSGVSLIVDNGSDPDGGTLTYWFELDRVATFDSADKQVSPEITEGTTTTEWAVTGLMENTTYYWRAKVSDGLIESHWVEASFTANATNSAPNAPTMANPGDGAWVATLQPILAINPVVDPDGDTLEYRFQLYSDETLSALVAESVLSGTRWSLSSPLLDNAWYYWRARAEDPNGGESDWSPTSRFYVDDNGVDDTPTLSFIEPSANREVSNGVTTLRWCDEDPDSSASITLYYDNDNAGADGTRIVDAIQEDADEAGDAYDWRVTTVTPGTYWVYAVIDDGNSSTTVYSDFSITVHATEILFDNRGPNVTVTGEWASATEVSGYAGNDYQYHIANGPSPNAVLIDNGKAGFRSLGDWLASTAVDGYVGDNFQYHTHGDPTKAANWYFNVPQTEQYRVFARWTAHPNRSANATYTFQDSTGFYNDSVIVNQQVNGGVWNLLGTYDLTAEQSIYNYRVSLTAQEDGVVVADAITVSPVSALPNQFSWHLDIPLTGRYQVYARWTAHPNRATNATYQVHHDAGTTPVTVNQQTHGAQWHLLGSFNFTQGGAYQVDLTDQANGRVIADAIRLVPID
jgi:hypothetical protein